MTTRPSRSTDSEPPASPSGGPTGERLQKVLAHAGVASRRHAEELITSGRVAVDGRVVTELGTRVTADARIEVDGEHVQVGAARRYFLLDKPSGYLTTVTDPHGRRTVMEFVGDEAPGLFPVGRLDLESEGLLVLTDDGELANRLTHPRYHVPKTYEAHVEGVPDARAVRALEEGIELEDGLTAPAVVGGVRRANGDAVVTITLREGKKRQVRRMCAAVGHPVRRLVRVKFGPLSRAGLSPGELRSLGPDEVRALRESTKGGS